MENTVSEQKSYDVILCHNGKNKLEVQHIADELVAHGIRPGLNERELSSGLSLEAIFREALDDQ